MWHIPDNAMTRMFNKDDSPLKITVKILTGTFFLWFFFIFIKWGPNTTIYSKCFKPISVHTDDLFYNTYKQWKVPAYSYFSPSVSEFQKEMLSEGYRGYVSIDPVLIYDTLFDSPTDVTLDGKVIVRESSTLEELLDPGDLVFVSAVIGEDKYIIPDYHLATEIIDSIQDGSCYVESFRFELNRRELD